MCCGVGYILSGKVKCMVTVCVPATCITAFIEFVFISFLIFTFSVLFVLILQVYTGDDDDDNDGFPEFILRRVRVLGALPVARRRNSLDTPPSSSSCR